MEKRVVLAIAISIALFAVYATWFAPRPAPARPTVSAGTAPATGQTVRAGQVAPGDHGEQRRPSELYRAAEDQALEKGRLRFVVDSQGGALEAAEAWACEYHPIGDRAVRGDPGAATAWAEGMPGALAVDILGAEDVPDLPASSWKLSREGDTVVAAFEDAGGLSIVRTLRLSDDEKAPYHGIVRYTLRNVSAQPGRTRTLEIVGPVMPHPTMPDDGVIVAPAGDETDVEFHTAPDVHSTLEENPRFESPRGNWAFLAVRADFYLGALVPLSPLPAETTVSYRKGWLLDERGRRTPTAAATFRIPLVTPAPGGEVSHEFMFYAGPNQRSLLTDESSPYRVLERATVNRTFIISLGPIERFLAWLLKHLAATGMGYGLAVLALTVLVRGALFPLSRKSQISMRMHAQRMQRLKPKMDALKEKHKDPRKQQEAMMKLMREEKVSLLPGGCWLAFAQMPIWIALYNVLQTTFEMRHARFLWVEDLTAPDRLVRLPFAEGWPVLDGWLNLLPILMMVVWYASAAMQPLPADPQQAQQAKMMRWMPVLFGVFLYGTAAGLTLYMTMSALWSIGETWLIKRLWLAHLEPAKA